MMDDKKEREATPIPTEETSPQYQQIIYVSAAKHPFSQDQLKDLLAVSRRNNHARDISGILLYLEGSFLQVLEGAPQVVEKLYAQISEDQRHHRVSTVLRRVVSERSFPDWRMAFVNMTKNDLSTLVGYCGYSEAIRSFYALQGDTKTILKVVNGFREGQWRQRIS